MDHVCAGRRLRLSFVRDADLIEAVIDDRQVGAGPHETLASLALAWAVRRQPRDVNHLVLAAERPSGRHQGFLVAHDGATDQESFLLLDASLAAGPNQAEVVLRRMIGLAVLRLVGFGQTPAVLAARLRQPILCQALHDLSRHVPGAAFLPDPARSVIPLSTASLLRRIGRITNQSGVAVLDLRAAAEPALIDGARWLYRARRRRA